MYRLILKQRPPVLDSEVRNALIEFVPYYHIYLVLMFLMFIRSITLLCIKNHFSFLEDQSMLYFHHNLMKMAESNIIFCFTID